MSFFEGLTGQVNNTGNFNQASKKLDKGYEEGLEYGENKINPALLQGQSYLDQGIAGLNPEQTQQGMSLYGTLAGLNGGEAGYNAFTDSVDKRVSNAALEQASMGFDRRHNANGMYTSGNNLIDQLTFGDQFNQDLLANARGALEPYFGQGDKIADMYTKKADFGYTGARDLAELGFKSKVGSGQAKSDKYMNMANEATMNAANEANFWGNIINGVTGIAGKYAGKA